VRTIQSFCDDCKKQFTNNETYFDISFNGRTFYEKIGHTYLGRMDLGDSITYTLPTFSKEVCLSCLEKYK
jgi:hypothetical protein